MDVRNLDQAAEVLEHNANRQYLPCVVSKMAPEQRELLILPVVADSLRVFRNTIVFSSLCIDSINFLYSATLNKHLTDIIFIIRSTQVTITVRIIYRIIIMILKM